MFYRTLFLAVLLLTQVAQATPQDGRDEIFPPKAAAQDAIHWDNGYFVINGQPTFISSGSIHYARVPRELWRDRIWRLTDPYLKHLDDQADRNGIEVANVQAP